MQSIVLKYLYFGIIVKNITFRFFVFLFSFKLDRIFFLKRKNFISGKNSTFKYNISLALEIRGGGKKRKKKNFTKPKKNKHIKKKIILRYLNYYSIESGKIKKLRKVSPESPGCFMAEHTDRLSCGKTGLTYTRV
nr:40S ribosomal protein S27A [Cryptomonas curvata]